LIQLLSFSNKIDQFILFWIFAFIISFTHQFIMKLVKPTYFMLFLFIDVVALLDLNLISNYKIFFLVLFT
jgi:hypothetical protein